MDNKPKDCEKRECCSVLGVDQRGMVRASGGLWGFNPFNTLSHHTITHYSHSPHFNPIPAQLRYPPFAALCYLPLTAVPISRSIKRMSSCQSSINLYGLLYESSMSDYFSGRTFNTREDAIAAMVHVERLYNPWQDRDDLSKEVAEREMVTQVPGTGKWVIGPAVAGKRNRTVRPTTFPWDGIDIQNNSLAELEADGYVNMFDNPRLSKVEMVNTKDVMPSEPLDRKDIQYVKELSRQLRKGELRSFKAIVVDEEGTIIDGHHRWMAAKSINAKTIPVQRLLLPAGLAHLLLLAP